MKNSAGSSVVEQQAERLKVGGAYPSPHNKNLEEMILFYREAKKNPKATMEKSKKECLDYLIKIN